MVLKYPCPTLESGIPCAKNAAYESGWQACLARASRFLTAEQVLFLQDPRIK
jgi:hypothetical protein